MGFLSKITGLFGGGGAKAALDSAGGILKAVDGLSTSAEEKADLRSTVVTSMVEAQSSVIRAEMTHGSWLSRSWRPIVMLMFACIIVAHFFLFPLIVFIGWADAALLTAISMPTEMWSLLTLGIGGYMGGRSVEKIVDKVMPNMKLAKMKKKLLKKFTPQEVKEMFDDEG